jgi:DUF917 family protein
MSRAIDRDNLRDLAMGAAILSAGGGSYPYLEALSALHLLESRPPVPMIDAASLSDDARVACVAMAGAPLPLFERIVDPAHYTRPVEVLERYLGAPMDAVMGYEIGSMNAMIPVIVAATKGLPLVDADTFGRSFPQGNMTTFAIAGVPMTPMALSDVRANDVIITDAVDGDWTERTLRSVTTAWGSIAAVCGVCSGAVVKQHALHGTYSRASLLGRSVIASMERHADVVSALLAVERGVLLIRGKVVDVERRATDGFVRGDAKVVAAEGSSTARLLFQNEYSVVELDGQRVSTVPDLICVFDSVRGEPIGTEALRYGQQVAVVSLPAMAVHLTPRALAIVGPRGFGYDFDYVTCHRGTDQ